MASAVLRKSITDLTRRRARTVFVVATLALAVASVGILALPPMMDRAMQEEVAANRLADVTVYLRPLALSAPDLAALERLPNVAAVEPRTAFRTRVYAGERRTKALVIGVRDFARQRVDVVQVAGGSAPARGAVLTDVQNARRDQYEGRTGDVVRVIAADGAVRRLRVSGEGRNLDGGQEVTGERTAVLYATPATVAALSGQEGYSSLALRVRDHGDAAVSATVEAVRRRLAAEPGFEGFTELPLLRAPGTWPGQQELDDISTLFSIVTILALLAALVLIANTMATLVGEQAGEIATMKAIGGRRRQIAGVYVRTALMLGALGTVVGAILGVALANLLVGFFGSEFFAIDPALDVDVPVLLVGAVVGVLGPPLAALPAIRRGTRVTVREGLQAVGSPLGGQGRLDAGLRRVGFLPRPAQIGLRGAGRRRRRSLATALQVALAVGTMLAVLGLGSGVADTVHGAWRDHGWNLWLNAVDRPFDARAAQLVRSTPGVAEVEPIVTADVQLAGEDAFTWGTAARTMFGYRIAEGRWYSSEEDRGAARVAVIERSLARATGTRLGDAAALSTAGGRVVLRIVGIADNNQESGTVVFVPLGTARSLAGLGDAASAYWVRTTAADHDLVDRTATRVEDRLVARGYELNTEVTYVGERNDAETYGTISTTITVLGFLIIAISLVGLVNAITMSVLERTREIGVLRCIGARGRDVRGIFATEGLALTLVGWLLGVPLGYALDRFLVWLVRESVNVDVSFAFPLWHLPLVLAGTVVLALAAMLPALRRAARFRPGDALRYA